MDTGLMKLLEQMSRKFDHEIPVGSETLSWKAHRIAEKLNDLSIVPELLEYAADSESNFRKQAIVVLGYIAQNTKDEELVNKLLGLSPKLDENEDALYNLLMAIWESGVDLKKGAIILIGYTTDERELIRNAAIRVLGNFTGEKELVEKALLNVVENYYDNYDLRYALESLMKTGTIASLEMLERGKKEINNDEMEALFDRVINKLK